MHLRWPGTDFKAGFVIYAENGPREVFGVSLGVRMSTHYEISQVSGRGTPVVPWCRPQPHMRHCAGRWAVVKWLVSEGHRTQSALWLELAVAHDYGLGWGAGRAHVVSNGHA